MPYRDLMTEARLATGVKGVDEILGGGFPERRLYLLQGDPGTGKTTLALQFLLAGVAAGEPADYVTLSETAEELRGVARSHGWSLDGIELFDLDTGGDRVAPEAQQTVFQPAEVELQDLVRRLLAVVDRVRPVRLVLDSLSELRLVARDPLRYRRQLLAMKQAFVERHTTVLLLDDRTGYVLGPHTPGGDDMQLQSLAHGVVLLEQFWPVFGDARRRIRVLKMRGVRYRGGAHDLTIETGGVVVYPRLVAAEHRTDLEGEQASTGIPALDTLLGGGIHRGSSTLVTGPAGAGKTTLLAQFAAASVARGERAALFVFDEVLGTFVARARGLGIDLDAHLRSGALEVRQIDPGELAPGQFIHAVVEAVQRGARLVGIDSLNGYLNAALDERALQIQLHELFSYLAQRGVLTFTTVAQHGLFSEEARGPVDVSYLADNVLLLRYFEAGGRVRKALSVMKQRRGAHETTIREIGLGADGVHIGEPLAGFHGVLTGVPTYAGESGALMGNAAPTQA